MKGEVKTLDAELAKRNLEVFKDRSYWRLKVANTSAMEHKNVGYAKFSSLGAVLHYLVSNPNLCSHNIKMYL